MFPVTAMRRSIIPLCRIQPFNSSNSFSFMKKLYHPLFGVRKFSQELSVREVLREENIGKQVKLKGWVKTVRSQKQIGFIELNDGSCLKNAQIVISIEESESLKLLKSLNVGCSIEMEGMVIQSPGKGQTTEIIPLKNQNTGKYEVNLVGDCDVLTYPLQNKRHSPEFLREIGHLRPRTNTFSAVMRTRNSASMAIHSYFQKNNFFCVHTPLITSSDCEGAGEQFQIITTPHTTKQMEVQETQSSEKTDGGKKEMIDPSKTCFFGTEAFLTVSGQLEAEIFACALSKVYTFGPTFRAETGKTSRHLAEFWMVEMEEAFADLNRIIERAENLIKHVVKSVMNECPEDISFFQKWIDKTLMNRLQSIIDHKFQVISYTEAIEILEKSGKKFTFPIEWGCNLQSEHELYICEEYFKQPTFVTDYPEAIKPFYARVNENDRKTVAAVDLLVPRIGELIGGSQREERYDILKDRMKAKGMSQSDKYDWYLELRKYGTVHHSGFGLGFERLMLLLTGVENIRDVIPIPRSPGNIRF